jgi:alanine racemase
MICAGDNPGTGRPTWAEVDLGAVVRNYRRLKSQLGASPSSQLRIDHPRIIPVLKADAYGHGAVPVARALSSAGASAFAVAIVEEAEGLRHAGITGRVLVLEGAWPGQEGDVIEHGLETALFSLDALERLDAQARRRNRVARVQVKVDTGMARLGIAWDGLEPLLRAVKDRESIRLSGVFSHLACADEQDSTFTEEQIRRFCRALDTIRALGLDPGEIHLANSAGLLHCPTLSSLTARPGIALYGYAPVPDRCPIDLEPALTWKTRVGRIHTVPAGASVGYNRRFRAARTTIAATLPVGYADGYRRGLSGCGRVIIRDAWADVLGAVSMDLIVVDITDIPDVREGEEVVLLGATPSWRYDAAVWADRLHTIPYEILCGISPRVPRVYRNPAAE